jgi:hypothetical protein
MFQSLKVGDEVAEVTEYCGRKTVRVSTVTRVTKKYVVIETTRYSKDTGREAKKADWYDSTRHLMPVDDPALVEIRIRSTVRYAISSIGRIEVHDSLDPEGCEQLLSRIEATVRSARKRIADLSS